MARPPTKGETGRGAGIDPPNRFESTSREEDLSQLEFEPPEELRRPRRTEFLADDSKSILTTNDSPDVGFDMSVNPYRGCEHGCAYCYARPTHETLGMGAGLDFETKIVVKHAAPKLLREALLKPSYRPQPIAFSGVTDCYQPAERRFRLTRQCLEVLHEFRNPVSIITKNALILRDLDLLAEMAAKSLAQVFLSVTSLESSLQQVLEPRTAPPAARLEAIRRLSAAGVPVGVLVAPVIPGLTDEELPKILAAAAQAGARTAGYVMLRLPLSVRPIFLDWLERHAPLKKDRVESLLREMRGGELNVATFGERMRGEGPYAKQIAGLFRVFTKRYGLDGDLPELDVSRFRRVGAGGWVQGALFGD